MIEVSNLTKNYNGFTAVDHLSFKVEEGETLILLGTSGCGKTTTLKMINRLIEPTSGQVFIEGQDVRNKDPEELRKRIGYVIQTIGLFPHYTVAQNIGVVPTLLKWDENKKEKRIRELMELLDLPPDDFMHRYPHELSGGQKQRVGLARALAADPPLVLLDEPFGALDPITRMQIQKEFKRLETILHKTMVQVTHDMFEAIDLGDKICLMDQGTLQQLGTPKELLLSPSNDFVKDFFQANRFQLELKVITLRDIVPRLKKKKVDHEPAQKFKQATSLLEVLEEMEKHIPENPVCQVTDKDGRPLINSTCEDIFSAFYHLERNY